MTPRLRSRSGFGPLPSRTRASGARSRWDRGRPIRPTRTKRVDSTEFYVPYRVHGKTRYSVTTNCIGALPTGTVVAPTIVSAKTAHCGQINPFHQHKFISGVGITTTFPDGTFSETCNTPNFH